MKWITFQKQNGDITYGWIQDEEFAIDLNELSSGRLPNNLLDFISGYSNYQEELAAIRSGNQEHGRFLLSDVKLLSPIPRPTSVRDFYAFEEHVKTARGRRGLDVVPEWYDFPVFYFTNHLAIKGPDDDIERPANCNWLDYELEIACVIGKEGRNISSEEADDYIFGYCIMNDWSARDIQAKEMKVGRQKLTGRSSLKETLKIYTTALVT
jgi:2-keto-4-pentenoate hydratase/2-oxohepta-3-ene-1,7-dioic acid hydratase in catechol pathway